MMKWRVHQPDCPRIDVAEDVSADHLVRRTDVGARRATYAPEGFAGVGIGPHRRTTVVDQHQVQLTLWFGSSDERGVGGDLLASPRAGQQADLRHRVVERGHDLFPSGDHDEQARQRAHQIAVALVGDQHDGARLRDQRVGADHARVGREERTAELLARQADLGLHVIVGHGAVCFGLEQGRHLLAALVDRRHDHMAGRLVCQLDDPLAQIRLDHLDPGCLEVVAEEDLLGDHALAFGQQLHAVGAENGQDRVAGLVRRIDLMDLRAAGLCGGDERSARRWRVGQHLVLGLDQSIPRGVEAHAHAPEGRVARGAPGALKGQQVFRQAAVGQRLAIALSEGSDHPWPTTMISTARGPWTPTVMTRSMSAERLGPLINRGWGEPLATRTLMRCMATSSVGTISCWGTSSQRRSARKHWPRSALGSSTATEPVSATANSPGATTSRAGSWFELFAAAASRGKRLAALAVQANSVVASANSRAAVSSEAVRMTAAPSSSALAVNALHSALGAEDGSTAIYDHRTTALPSGDPLGSSYAPQWLHCCEYV